MTWCACHSRSRRRSLPPRLVRLISARPYTNERARRSHPAACSARTEAMPPPFIRQTSSSSSFSFCTTTTTTIAGSMSSGEHPGRTEESSIPPIEAPFSAFAYTSSYRPTSSHGVVIPTPIRKAPGETQVPKLNRSRPERGPLSLAHVKRAAVIAGASWRQIEGVTTLSETDPELLAVSREGCQSDEEASLNAPRKRVRKKRFPCSSCQKLFATKYERTRHQRTHTGERPFCCLVCGRAFADKGNLKKHNLVHTRMRPYPCPQCGKGFSRRTHLRVHMRTHPHAPAVDGGEGSNSE